MGSGQPQATTPGQLEVGPENAPGITGWLAFFSIGVWATPLMFAYYSIQSWIEASHEFEKSIGRPLDFGMVYLLSQRVAEDWNAAIFFAVIAVYVGLIGVSIWFITQWWNRKRHFPRNWIIFQAGLLVFAFIVGVVTHDPKVLQPRDLIVSMAHILFWWKSRQAAATFTH